MTSVLRWRFQFALHPKMLKMASGSFIHDLLLFLSLFSPNFPLGAPVT